MIGGSRRVVLWVLGAVLMGVMSGVGASATEEPSAGIAHATDHVLVKVAAGMEVEGALGQSADGLLGDWRCVDVPEGKTPEEAVQELRSTEGVETASIDPIVQLDPISTPVPLGHVPSVGVNDPLAEYQWHLDDAPHPGFKDVPTNATFASDISQLATAGATKGCNPPANDMYCPKDPVTRVQAAAFLVRALGLSEGEHAGFADVPANTTFADDIGMLATVGITRGCNPPDNDSSAGKTCSHAASGPCCSTGRGRAEASPSGRAPPADSSAEGSCPSFCTEDVDTVECHGTAVGQVSDDWR